MSTEAARALMVDLHLLGRVMRGALAVTVEAGSHPGGLGVLLTLAGGEPRRQNELAADMCLSPSALSRHITELVNDGYVDRQADPADGRATLLSLTPAGRELLERSRDIRARKLQDVLAGWTEAEADAARVSIQKLKDSLIDYAHRVERTGDTAKSGILLNSKESQDTYV